MFSLYSLSFLALLLVTRALLTSAGLVALGTLALLAVTGTAFLLFILLVLLISAR